MKKKIFGLLISIIGLVGAVIIYKNVVIAEYVKNDYALDKTSKQREVIAAQSINRQEINIIVDGKNYQSENGSLYMGDTFNMMIPVDMIGDAFDCSVHIYDNEKLLIEKGKTVIEATINEKAMRVNDKTIMLEEAVIWKDDLLFVSMEIFEKGLGYSQSWDSNANCLIVMNKNEEIETLPYYYNYVEKGRIGEAKDQGDYGTCWSFATLTAIETSLMPQEKLDFSREHMTLANSFQTDLYMGGEYMMALAYLTAWQGPVYESEDAYGDGYTPKDLEAKKHIQEVQIMDSKDIEMIKKTVFKYGGVQSSLYTSLSYSTSSSYYYNKDTYAYCYIGEEKPNHDIVIIGWDDNYSKNNFTMEVEGDGAFICRNSWGEKFGDQGNFYVSYYDTNIGVHNIVYTRIDDPDNYNNIYQTDLCGWVGKLGYKSNETAYFSNVYTAKNKEQLAAVSFYTTEKNAEYEVYVCKNFNGKKSLNSRGDPVAVGKLSNLGYYTIDLDKEILLEKGEKYAVVVKMYTPNSTKPIAIEYSVDYQTANVDISDGEGYYSLKGTSWERAEDSDFNICLKAFTNNIK